MPKAYSLELRERVARFVEAGRSCHAAAAHFSVPVAFREIYLPAILTASLRAGHKFYSLIPSYSVGHDYWLIRFIPRSP
jgi:hypothetical protein